MAKKQFSRGLKVRQINTDIPHIETEHAKNEAAKSGAKRLPFTHIQHDPETNTYHVSMRHRDNQGNVSKNGDDTLHTEKTFLKHVLHLFRGHPKMQPFPTEASMTTKPNGLVKLRIAHKDYK